MIVAAYAALGLATALFLFRLLRGPSLADRVIGIDGIIVTGMSLIIVQAMDTGRGRVPPDGRGAGPRVVHQHLGDRSLHRGAGRVIGELVTFAGAVLVLLSAVGVIRFPDALARMHALTKASTVGVVLVAVGSAFVLPTANDITSALAAALLQILTLPISASLLGRATYLARGIPNRVDAVDELADVQRRPPAVD